MRRGLWTRRARGTCPRCETAAEIKGTGGCKGRSECRAAQWVQRAALPGVKGAPHGVKAVPVRAAACPPLSPSAVP
eukprot:133205-Prymnesium_polylepis.1